MTYQLLKIYSEFSENIVIKPPEKENVNDDNWHYNQF